MKKQLSLKDARTYRRLLRYLAPYRLRFAVALLAALPVALVDGGGAFLAGPLTDVLLQADANALLSDPSWLTWLLFALVGGTLLKGLFETLSNHQTNYLANAITRDLRADLFLHLGHLNWRHIKATTTGELMSRYFNDPAVLQEAVVNNLRDVIIQSLRLAGLVAVLLYRNALYAVLALSIISLMVWPIQVLSRRIRRLDYNYQTVLTRLLNVFTDAVAGAKLIKAYNLQAYNRQRFAHGLDDFFLTGLRIARASILIRPLVHIIGSVGVGLVLWIGLWQVSQGQMTPGELTSFLVALGLVYAPVKTLGSQLGGIQRILAPAERVFEKLDVRPDFDEQPELQTVPKLSPFKDLRLVGVYFAYEDGQDVLRNVHLTVLAGDVVALVGPSGGGKSTLADLLPRLMDPTRGRILYNGQDIRELPVSALRRQIAVVSQDTQLFNGSIRENLMLANPQATQTMLESAVASACLQEWLAQLPQGLETCVGERGVQVSGGQRQRIAIARAFLKDAPILVLDEATSALDNESEALVQTALVRLMAGRTVLFIAHRLSSLRIANRVVVIENGQVVESGTPESLLKNEQGAYYRLANAHETNPTPLEVIGR
ncbi:MAG: ABC transporter ATP-binding protein [Candidatus Melainabacteria bacterium]|nr:ABC transporter ATP-binding protein [Candidatus Melainabacteria bacterium]